MKCFKFSSLRVNFDIFLADLLSNILSKMFASISASPTPKTRKVTTLSLLADTRTGGRLHHSCSEGSLQQRGQVGLKSVGESV